MEKIYIIVVILLVWGCEKTAVDRPEPFAKPEKVEILLDFTYRESTTVSGYVAFANLSRGFQSYKWDFGYTDANGQAAISTDATPYTFFPANGEYLVILTGTDVTGKEQLVRQYVVVKNKVG